MGPGRRRCGGWSFKTKVGKLDLNILTQDARNKHPGADVLNGIAYDSVSDKIYVTGKMWSNIYQINFNH